MNKKVMIIIISITLIVVIILIINNFNKSKFKKSENDGIDKETKLEIGFEDDNGNKFKSVWSESNLVYEIYDENGNLVAISPTESGVKEYMENPELMFNLNNE